MKKQYYVFAVIIVLILGFAFYWYEFRPSSIMKECFGNAYITKQNAINADNKIVESGLNLTKRADYDKIFNDEYKNCLMMSGIKE